MKNTITISNLVVHAVIGVYAAEQAIRQPLWLTLTFPVNADRAAENDALSDTVDYAAVCRSTQQFVDTHACRLLETFVNKLAHHLKKQFHLSEVTILATKKPKDLPHIDGVLMTYTDRA